MFSNVFYFMSKIFRKHIDDIPLTDSHGGMGKRRLLLSSADMMSDKIGGMTKVYLPAGAVFDWHNHDELDEFFIVLSGKGVIRFEDGTVLDYKEDDLVYIPSLVSHRIEGGRDKECVFYFIRVKN